MSARGWLIAVLVLLLTGCSSGVGPRTSGAGKTPVSASEETSIGSSVPQDDPGLSHADSAGNTPDDLVIAYVRATNRQDWKTRWALIAPLKADLASVSAAWAETAPPYDDFRIHETRVVEPGRALVRVTYATVGFSSQEGLTPEESRRLVVVREPGEWWVVVKGVTDDALWGVTFKGPQD